MSTGKEYNELILDLLKEQGKDISDIKEDIAEEKTLQKEQDDRNSRRLSNWFNVVKLYFKDVSIPPDLYL